MRIINKITNDQFIDDVLLRGIFAWQEHLSQYKHFSKHTVINYLSDLGYFLFFLRQHLHTRLSVNSIQNLQTQDWQQWFIHRQRNQFTSTRRAIASIKNFCHFLQKNQFIEHHNCHQIITPKTRQALPRAINQKSILKLINHIVKQDQTWIGKRNYVICLLIYGCGLRISEVLQITPALSQNQNLIIQGKGKKERLIPIIPIISQALKDYLTMCPYFITENQAVFIGLRGKPLRPEIVQRFIRQARLQLDMGEQITPHTFRHCFASHLLEKDVDLRTIQELMGHQNLSTTQQYTKINTKKLTAVYQASHPFALSPQSSAQEDD